MIHTEQFQWSAIDGWQPRLNRNTVQPSAQLVFVFGSPNQLEQSRVFEIAREACPQCHVVGCSTAGEIHGTSVCDETLTVTAVSFEHTRIATSTVRIESPAKSFEAGEALTRALAAEGLRHILVFSEGLRVNASEFVNGINSVLPEG